MAEKAESKTWGLATASQISAAFRAARMALTVQNVDLRYTAAINPIAGDGVDSVVGLTDDDLFSDGPTRDIKACKDRVMATGHAESLDISVSRDGEAEWHRLWVEPLRDNGVDTGVLAAAVDITQLKAAEEHLRLALLELAHRSKNLLAVVLSIARQSADESETLPQFRTRFVGRIHSLALAHDVLTDERWRGATLFGLARSQLDAFSETAVSQAAIDGHNAYLKPNAVQYVGLALHELVSQSVVSGALSQPKGRIRITGMVTRPQGEDSPPDLLIQWNETGILRRSAAETSKFGHALLEEIVPSALSGKAKLDASKPGLVYELTLPASQFF